MQRTFIYNNTICAVASSSKILFEFLMTWLYTVKAKAGKCTTHETECYGELVYFLGYVVNFMFC